MLKFDKFLYRLSSFEIFICSVVFSIGLLFIERLVGIGPDYHPDARTYIENSSEVVAQIFQNPLLIFNNAHYFLVWTLFNEYELIHILNVVIFSFTNVILNKLNKRLGFFEVVASWILFVNLFNPYRLHLSTTILKDTIIIGLMVYCVAYGQSLITSLIGLMFRLAFVIYMPIFLKTRYYLLCTTVAAFAFILDMNSIIKIIENQNEVNMQFRSFDIVPNFSDLGIWGVFVRMITWPFLIVTGVYAILSPSLIYTVISFGSFCSLFIMHKLSDIYIFKYDLLIKVYISMAAFAIAANGFTTYTRYVYPIFVVMPYLFFGVKK